MAYSSHVQTFFFSNGLTALSNFFATFANAISGSAAMDQRMHRVAKLNAKTDAELAAMNLRRADIPSYVFRDLMHI